MTVHNFNDSLKSALTDDNKELLVQACQEFFPMFNHMTYYERYSKHSSNLQARGVDWLVSLKDPNGHGRTILIDDKVSGYSDDGIFLEAWGDEKKTKPGWISDPTKVCDYIAFLKPKLTPPTVYFFPFHLLQRAWKLCGDDWTKQYGLKPVRSESNGQAWKTWGVPVPAPEIYAAMAGALVIPVPS